MEKVSHLKSDEDFYATPKFVGLAVYPQSDPYFRAFSLSFGFPGKRTGTHGLQTATVPFALIPNLDNYRMNRCTINNSVSNVQSRGSPFVRRELTDTNDGIYLTKCKCILCL